MDKNIVADNIPAASAHNELPLPLQGPFEPTIRLPLDVANVQPKLMSWNMTEPSDTHVK
jgi:hypothetical protein